MANFILGFLYHERKYVKRDMKLAIQNYKESSSFNNEFSKNNLGIIYKHGNENEGIPKNIGLSIEYFKDAIRKKDDMVSKYNLAHLYFYEGLINENIDKVIELLQESFMQGFDPSLILLCMAFIKKYGYNVIVMVSKTKI